MQNSTPSSGLKAAVGMTRYSSLCSILLLMVLWPASSWAQLDLQKVQREQLPNGLTLLLLEEHSFPSVSVQMLYRVGGRNEPAGQSGIAHFLEHMAFRASENFPDTEVVSRIYAAGGEWHGYTWIDQTTYFSTVPSDQLDLLLRIEADRMQHLLIEPRWIEPEKGAVLAEMHGYENDPAGVLHDAVVFAAFQAHPYRNNVIGWEADILALQQSDVVNFYWQHYSPANAVLAIVGDFDAKRARRQVAQLFGEFPSQAATPLPHTVEPPQLGQRHIEMLGAGDSSYFEIAYPAPAANDPDFAAMLVMQQWLSGGSGVNFMQEYGTTYAEPGTALYAKLDGLSTWFPPSAQRYLFSIRGSVSGDFPIRPAQQETGQLIEAAFQQLRDGRISEADLQHSKQRVLEELVYDLGTHEEAAHQLAFYDGLNALDEWLALPRQVTQVSNADLVELANRYLQPWQQTAGWFHAGAKPSLSIPRQRAAQPQAEPQDSQPAHSPRSTAVPAPQLFKLEQGLPLLVQENPTAAAAFVSLILEGNQWQGSTYLQSNDPLWGVSSLSSHCLPDQLKNCVTLLLAETDKLVPDPQSALQSSDPATRLNGLFEAMLGLEADVAMEPEIRLAVLTGKLQQQESDGVKLLLNHLSGSRQVTQQPVHKPQADVSLDWPYELSQAQLGYVVNAPLPTDEGYIAWRALQYILAHDYEGRLGKQAISNSGLAYYIDSQYRSDGQRAWVSLSAGVDPGKLAALELMFREQITGLTLHPPTEAEVAEAKQHLMGRLATARQSNTELAAGLTEQWLWYGQLLSKEEQIARINKLDRQHVLAAIPAFSQGAFAIIKADKSGANVTD